MTAILVFAALFILLLGGLPIAFALAGIGATLLLVDGLPLVMVPQALFSGVDNFILLSVPLFLLMSNVLLRGGVGGDLFAAVQSWVGHWPGGLAVATVISCALFSAMSGSSVATAATIATVAIPEMVSRGYSRPFVFGLIAAGGTLGILIPPSIPLIVYGVITDASISKLFLAGVIPGLSLCLLFIGYSMIRAYRDPSYVAIPKALAKERLRLSLRAIPTLLIAAAIFAGIYGGIFTPTEASAAGLFLALVVTVVILRSITWAGLRRATMDSLRTTATIFMIIVGAKLFAKALTLHRVPQDVAAWVTAGIADPTLFLLAVSGVLLVLGLFLESNSMLLIVVPVLLPTLAGYGIDPLWFGIYFMILIECALITPPVGLNLFVIQAVAKADPREVIGGVLPFIWLMLGYVVLLYLFPGMALWMTKLI